MSNRNPRPSEFLNWGDTTGPTGLRVFAHSFPPSAKLKDFERFFRTCGGLKGISVRRGYAFIYFNYTSGVSNAITRDMEGFAGGSIRIKPFQPRSPKNSNSTRKLQERYSDSYEDNSRTLCRRKSRSRSESRSDSRSENRALSQSPTATEHNDPREMPRMNREEAAKILSSYCPDLSPVKDLSRPWLSSGSHTTGPETLPRDIELLLRLIIEQKNGRSLSVKQIDDIVRYLNNEKIATAGFQSRPLSEFTVRPAFFHNVQPIHPIHPISHSHMAPSAPIAGPSNTTATTPDQPMDETTEPIPPRASNDFEMTEEERKKLELAARQFHAVLGD